MHNGTKDKCQSKYSRKDGVLDGFAALKLNVWMLCNAQEYRPQFRYSTGVRCYSLENYNEFSPLPRSLCFNFLLSKYCELTERILYKCVIGISLPYSP